LSSGQDFADVSAPTFLVIDTRFAVATNGTWGGVFTVPANAPALPATVTAVCMSDGLPSLLTIYLPAVFVVTAASPTPTVTRPPSGGTTSTSPTTPTTLSHPESTSPPSGPPGAPPTTAAPGTPGSSIADPASSPGHDFVGEGPSGSDGGPSATPSTTTPGSKAVDARPGTGEVAGAADLRAPSLDAPGANGFGGLGWLLWLLVLALLGLFAVGVWLFRARRQSPEPDALTDPQ
jgi:hypothetical protein